MFCFILGCCCCIFTSISLPCLVPTAPYHSTLSALHRSPRSFPPLMTVPFTPLGKWVISPSRWVCVPSDQLINYILAQFCSAFFDAKPSPSLHTCAAPQSGTGIAHQFEMLKHFCPLGPSHGLQELSVAPIGFNPSLESSNQSQCFCCCGLSLFGLLLKDFSSWKCISKLQILSCSSPKVCLKYWKCLVSGVVPNRWKSSLFKLFAVKRCDEGCICCIGPEDQVHFYYICSRGFPGKCSASISVCKEILLSGQSNK